MVNKDISTSSLLRKISRTRNIARLVRSYDDTIRSAPLNVHLQRLCDERNITPGDVIKKADLDKTYGYQIFNGTRQNPSRDVVIQIAFGFGMDYDETQELLKAASKSALYARVERDAVIIFALKKRYAILDVQHALEELNLPILGRA